MVEPTTLNKLLDLGIEIVKIGGGISLAALACFKSYYFFRGQHESKNKTALEGLLEQFKVQVVEIKTEGKSTRIALVETNGKLNSVHTDVEVLKAQVAPLLETLPRTTAAIEKLNEFHDSQIREAKAKLLEQAEIAPGVTKIKENKS